MKQIVQNYRSGELKLTDIPVPALRPRGVLVANRYSLVSAGTERMKVEQASMSLLDKARARPDQARQVLQSIQQQGLLDTFQKVMDRLDSFTPLGYSSAGVVLAAGAEASEFTAGDRVACGGAEYANHAEVIYVPRNLCVKVPDNVPLDAAAFTTVGAIALQGIRQAGSVVGDTVAVIGLGLLGQLCVQLLRAAGCQVVGVDINPSRARLAKRCGADLVLVRAEATPQVILGSTGGRGVDAVLITAATSSNDPLTLAADICRDRGRIVVVGAVRVEIPNTLKSAFYDKELELRMSRSYGPGRYDPTYEEQGVDYPIGYVRWTEKRNMEAFLRLLAEDKVDVSLLITHRFPFERAEEAYKLLTGGQTDDVIGILFDYGEPDVGKLTSIRVLQGEQQSKVATVGRDVVRVGLIGAGHHARAKLIPSLYTNRSVQLRGVATASGLTAQDVARKYGVAFATSDYREVLMDPDIDCVVIATRHDTHARFTVEALEQGKDVFVEKPLALSLDELRRVVAAQKSSGRRVLVGFNRRFAPHSQRLREFFATHTAPLMLIYRVNAGYQPPASWYQDPLQGGGRIVGEGGHFIDLMSYIISALPVQVYALAIPNPALPIPDDASLIIEFAGGSIGTLIYTSGGDMTFSKERLEVFGQGRVGVLDDFRSLTLVHRGRKKTYMDRLRQDKGHAGQMDAFIAAVKGDKTWPVPFEDNVITTLVTLLTLESLRGGEPLPVDLSVLTPVER